MIDTKNWKNMLENLKKADSQQIIFLRNVLNTQYYNLPGNKNEVQNG